MTAARWRHAAAFALLAAAAWWVYQPALHGGWLWDDDFDLLQNEALRSVGGLFRLWVAPATLDYYPLKSTVQWLQWQLWGAHVLGYHVTNVVLHVAAAVMIWRVLRQLGVSHGWFGALLFTVHPLAVESVAWMCELKNSLALPPLLLALSAFIRFEAEGDARWRRRAVGWFAVAMLCKSAVAMFPLTLALFLWWRRGTLTARDLRPLLPFFLISLVLGLTAVWFQTTRVLADNVIVIGGPLTRIALAGTVLVFYAGKALWPVGLLPIYPRWPVDPPALWQFAPWVVLLALVVWLMRNRGAWNRHALLGLGWFGLHLLPAAGLFTISYMRFSWTMDHMAYVALPGLIGLAVAGGGALMNRWPTSRIPLATLAVAVVALLAIGARRHAGIFRDAPTFWNYTLAHNPAAWPAHGNLGLELARAHRLPEAIDHYRAALALNPDCLEGRINLGNALREAGQPEEAIQQLEQAVRLRPDYLIARYNLALALQAAGHRDDALREIERALAVKPTWSLGLDARGGWLREAGRAPEAIASFEAALASDPRSATAHQHLGAALAAAGRHVEAAGHYEKALNLDPGYAEAYQNLALSEAVLGHLGDAIVHLQEALRLRPDFHDARLNLGILLLAANRPNDAVEPLEAVVHAFPDAAKPRFQLARALVASSRPAEAVPHFEAVLRADDALPEVHVQLALALAAAGRHAEANTHYARARALDPTLPPREL
jgi:protein O-mannosyl-transferase